jgi:hypothetical protein
MNNNMGGTTMDRIREWGAPMLALVAFLALLGIVGRMEMESMDDARYNECAEMLAHDDWDAAMCAFEWDDLSAIARQMWGADGDPETMHRTDCGMVMDSESVGMVPASCASESELIARMDAIRSERSGFRTWEGMR